MRGLWRFLRLDTQTTDVVYDVVMWCHGASLDVVIALARPHRPTQPTTVRVISPMRAEPTTTITRRSGWVWWHNPRNEYCIALMTTLYDRYGRFGRRRLDEAPDQTTRADANSTTRPTTERPSRGAG